MSEDNPKPLDDLIKETNISACLSAIEHRGKPIYLFYDSKMLPCCGVVGAQPNDCLYRGNRGGCIYGYPKNEVK